MMLIAGPPWKERFFAKTKRSENGCLLWVGARKGNGYGYVSVDGRMEYTHRAAWFLAYGELPAGKYVCHRCDNRACVEPAHLFLGTQTDNMNDMKSKGRHTFGERDAQAKLTEDDVRAILGATGVSQRALARRFGVCQQQVSRILRGQRWAHLNGREDR